MALAAVVAKTLQHFKRTGDPITPENYERVFCEEAKKIGFRVDSCEKINRYLNKLDDRHKGMAAAFRIRTVDELLMFLTGQLSRQPNGNKGNEQVYGLNLLAKKMLQTIMKLHNAKARELAKTYYGKDLTDTAAQNAAKKAFDDFNGHYNPAFLRKLDPYGPIDKEDLEKLVRDVEGLLRHSGGHQGMEAAADLLIQALTPSIAVHADDRLARLSVVLRKSPDLLDSEGMREDLTAMIRRRIQLDEEEMKKRLAAIQNSMDGYSRTLQSHSASAKNDAAGIREINKGLDAENPGSVKEYAARLADFGEKLVRRLDDQVQEVEERQEDVAALQEEIAQLKAQLEEAKEEARTDFLTGTLTRRGLQERIKELEEKVPAGKDYAALFFDIDRFGSLSQEYGQKAGDVVLATIGKFLLKSAKDGWAVCRYGQDEFVVIVPGNDEAAARKYGEQIRDRVGRSKFLYRGKRIPVSLGFGAAMRLAAPNPTKMLEMADQNMREARGEA